MTTYILVIWLMANSMRSSVSMAGALTSVNFESKTACEDALKAIQMKSVGGIDGVCVQRSK